MEKLNVNNMFRVDANSYCQKQITVFLNELPEAAQFAQENKCDGIYLRLPPCWNKMLDFDLSLFRSISNNIRHFSFEPSISINTQSQMDQLYRFTQLKSLFLPQKHILIDISKFKELEAITTYDLFQVVGFDKLYNLKILHLRSNIGYNLERISQLKSINKLFIVDSNIESLEGLSKLETLETLELSYNRKLKEIIQINTSSIKKLKILKCKHLTDLDIIKNNKSLIDIFCDFLDNLQFVQSMPNLKSLGFLNLQDGDMSYLLKSSVRNVRFTPNKKYYMYKEDEINKLLQKE